MSNNKQCQFEPSTNTSSATICKWCGQEKWKHNTTMSNNKQNSVEFLEQKFISIFVNDEGFKKAIDQAKAMQQEQAHQYAAFCIECNRQDLPLLDFNSWISLNETSGDNNEQQ